jgi:ABC-2 type transport system permease protein
VSATAIGPTRAVAAARASWVVALRTARKAIRSGLLWGVIFGLTYAYAALAFASAYKTQAERDRVTALFNTNAGLAAINGPAHVIDTPAGYGVWKSFMFVMVIGAVWGLLISTRLLRGEEDAGRWEVLLAGSTTRRGAAVQAIAGLGTGVAITWLSTWLITAAVGQSHQVGFSFGAAAYLALCFVCAPAMFVGIGALTSQIAPTRRQAAAIAAVVLGASYAIRMVADSSSDLEWLRWLSPLGWIETLQPLSNPRPLALIPIVLLGVSTRAVAVVLAGQRDVGAAMLRDGNRESPRTRLLDSTWAFSWRQVRGVTAGWMIAIAGFAFLLGLVAKQGGELLTSSSAVESAVANLGISAQGTLSYLGFTFIIVAAVVAFVAVSHVSALAGEENEGRLASLLVRPVSRVRWLAERAAIATICIVAAALISGLFAWIGAVVESVDVSLWTLLGAGLNVAPPTVCLLGIGVLAYAVWPRYASTIAYAVLAWSFLITVIGGFESSSHWLLDTSVFHHMAPVPGASPNWAAAFAMVAIGALCAGAGAALFRRRDVVGG